MYVCVCVFDDALISEVKYIYCICSLATGFTWYLLYSEHGGGGGLTVFLHLALPL